MNIQKLSSADLTGIGKAILVKDSMIPDGKDELQTYYGKIGALPECGGYQVGICIAKKRPMIVDELESHVQTVEFLGAMNGSFVVAAAPSKEVDGQRVPDVDKAVALLVEQGEAILFDVGVWHWTPFAVEEESNVLVIFKTDTPANDFNGYKVDPIEIV